MRNRKNNVMQLLSKPKSNKQLLTVTPATAERWLQRNQNNRTVRQRVVEEYALNMRLGRFQQATDIIIDWDGNLVDGQHRLLAVIEAGVPVQMWVMTDADPSIRYVVDTGIKRSNGDALQMRGIANSRSVASIARIMQIYVERLKANQFSALMTQEYAIAHNEEIQRSFHYGSRLRHTIRNANQSVFSAAHALFARKDPAAADAFFEQLINGNNLDKGHPILALRNSLLIGHRGTHVVRDQFEAAVRTWNHYRTGGQLSKVVTNGNIPEAV